MALARLGSAQAAGGDHTAATKSFDAAKASFENLREAGDHSEAVTYGLALTLVNEGENAVSSDTKPSDQAAALLRPLATGAKPPRRVRQLYAEDMFQLCLAQTGVSPQKGIPYCDQAASIAAGLGALELSDLDAADLWVGATAVKSYSLMQLGHLSEAQPLAAQSFALTTKILDRRPDDLQALNSRSRDAGYLLAQLARRHHDAAAAVDYAQKAVQAATERVRFDPSNLGAWVDWAGMLDATATIELDGGKLADAIATYRTALALTKDPRSPKGLGKALFIYWQHFAVALAMAGDRAGAEQAMANYERASSAYFAGQPPNSPDRLLQERDRQSEQGEIDLYLGAAQPALREATTAIPRVEAVKVPAADTGTISAQRSLIDIARRTAAGAAAQLGRYAQAEKIARARLGEPFSVNGAYTDPLIGQSQARYILALAVAKQGHKAEALKVLQPALAYYADQQKAGAQDTTFRHDYAYALYVDAIAQPTGAAGSKQRNADLDQAAKLIAGASTEAQRMAEFRYISGQIATARAGHDR
ncbi:MAG: hypothetical protein ACREPK_10560 [Rhodanobacteraceae bacterium]